jgi:hypothetical protein
LGRNLVLYLPAGKFFAPDARTKQPRALSPA